jgi:hypothetical protein
VEYGNALVSWRAIRQADTAQSTCEAEYIATSELAKELIWWRRFLKDMHRRPSGATTLFCDNKAAQGLSRHAGNFETTKHIRHRYHYIREQCEAKRITVRWCSTTRQWSKNCAIVDFRRIVTKLLGAPV